jgi:asparagine synthase (glutamine-hydrolysing)
MCGISGIINRNGSAVERELLERMNALIAHRGPDAEGVFTEGAFGFGHRRLAILDLSDEGHQPMHYRERYTITYNGEVYNFLELREELESHGYEFSSHTDTEVILAAYDKWGEVCVERFNGMWAFALYDRQTKKIFCSRDRFGIKPFYYAEVGGRFVFGSEIKQLLDFFEVRRVNRMVLADYLLYGLEEHMNETFFEGIFKLEQSHNLIYDLQAHTFEIRRYFDLKIDETEEVLNEAQSVAKVYETLERAVDLRLRSDVKVGTCLSGGLDSSSVAAIASKKYTEKSRERFMAIHAKSVETKTDESDYAWEVAEYCGLELIVVEPQLETISEKVKEVVYTQEEPFGGPSIFMQYFVMEQARAHGCTVMLDGQGGDETLFGYEGYFSFYFASLLKNLRLIRYVTELAAMHTFKVSKKRIVRDSLILLVRERLSFLEVYLRKRRSGFKMAVDAKRLRHLFALLDFKAFQKREIMRRNLPHLLRYEDKNAMRHGVETRLPFVDYRFVSAAVSVRDDLKFKKGYLKYVLRKAVEGLLPATIVWRTNKFGFEAPTDTWIEAHRGEMLTAIERSRLLSNVVTPTPKQLENRSMLWRLYNVAVWEEVYGVVYE